MSKKEFIIKHLDMMLEDWESVTCKRLASTQIDEDSHTTEGYRVILTLNVKYSTPFFIDYHRNYFSYRDSASYHCHVNTTMQYLYAHNVENTTGISIYHDSMFIGTETEPDGNYSIGGGIDEEGLAEIAAKVEVILNKVDPLPQTSFSSPWLFGHIKGTV
jgi:hypothetical protein